GGGGRSTSALPAASGSERAAASARCDGVPMRRRPQRLQVNTFPFLAVLLCAMGSLILVLLVMDRRAKAVAKHKAQEAALAAAAERIRKDEARHEEWETKRRALHALLVERHAALEEEVRQMQARVQAADRNLEREGQDLQSLASRLADARTLLAKEQAALAARQTDVAKTTDKDKAARSELDRLAGQLRDLEQTLAGLE